MKNMTTLVLGVMNGIAVMVLGAMFSANLWAHCDTLDGPVVADAKLALEKGNVAIVLKWVKAENEEEIKTVFNKVLAVRPSGKEAKELADLYFFETLVRLHRAGEGAGYSGLKPAGSLEPSVAAADKTIEAGSVDRLAKEIGKAAEKAVRERYERLMSAKKHKDESVDAGREYIEVYVEYVHFVETLHDTIMAKAAHHRNGK
jgi:hypothetical protein